LFFAALGMFLCHVPLLPWASVAFTGRIDPDPRWDVTNDMYGWDGLKEFLANRETLPVVGARYQTAAQAAFAMGAVERVSLIPRDRKQLGEWVDLGVSDSQGPAWPRLNSPVYFVADNRYSGGPEFQ